MLRITNGTGRVLQLEEAQPFMFSFTLSTFTSTKPTCPDFYKHISTLDTCTSNNAGFIAATNQIGAAIM